MKPLDDRYAKRLAELRQELAEQERELVLQQEQREREAAERETQDRINPVKRRKGNRVTSLLFLVAILALPVGLTGLAVTLNRMSPNDMADAQREGQATVRSCVKHGPISHRGFGYWYGCSVEIAWSDGQVQREVVQDVFAASDIGTQVRVGDLGKHRTRQVLARADMAPRPWLDWLSYAVGAIAIVPTFVAVMLLAELLNFRKYRRKRQTG